MLKIVDSTTASHASVSRRDFLQAGTAGALGVLSTARNHAAQAEAGAGKQDLLEVIAQADKKHLLWQPSAELTVQLLPPTFIVASEKHGMSPSSVKVHLIAARASQGAANFDYEVTVVEQGATRKGKYNAQYNVAENNHRYLLYQKTKLVFEQPLHSDLTILHRVQVSGKPLTSTTLPLSYGVVKAVSMVGRNEIAGHFALGRGATAAHSEQLTASEVGQNNTAGHSALGQGSTAAHSEELALPVIGLGSDDAAGGTFAIATDPHCGSEFRVHGDCGRGNAQRNALVSISCTYLGSLVPLREEERAMVFASHRGNNDGMLRTFYDTIPEILPSPSWVQDVQLTYYDDISSYNSEPGQGWYHDVQKLAEKIPTEHCGKVVLCLEAYYDYVGRYSYDHQRKQFDSQWNSYDIQARGVPMTVSEVHKRIKFAKDRGFRVIWYFGDGMAVDTSSPYYRKDWVIRDENGKYPSRGFWEWRPEWKDKIPAGDYPVLGADENPTNHILDPGNPQVCDWFMGYMEALLKEYGSELDGFTWDETFLVQRDVISTTGSEPTYSDRAFMRLVSRLSQLVQQWRKVNPNLVFLSSDNGMTPYALVAHGTWQDSACSPHIWPTCFLINYRTCLWSCNWFPVTSGFNNMIAVYKYGLPQGLSNGYHDDQGPSEMPGKILDRVIQRFLDRVKSGADRTRYLTNVADAFSP